MRFEEDLFQLNEPLNGRQAFLIPTAEVPITNLHAGEILDEVRRKPASRPSGGPLTAIAVVLVRLDQIEKGLEDSVSKADFATYSQKAALQLDDGTEFFLSRLSIEPNRSRQACRCRTAPSRRASAPRRGPTARTPRACSGSTSSTRCTLRRAASAN